jgi:RNA polymerase sigma factor (sigma-70 family)
MLAEKAPKGAIEAKPVSWWRHWHHNSPHFNGPNHATQDQHGETNLYRTLGHGGMEYQFHRERATRRKSAICREDFCPLLSNGGSLIVMFVEMTDGQQLLAEYVATGSEPAFRDLVTRYVDLVYSVAVRLVNGDTHLAKDITQIVFADLARMSRKLSPDVMVGGWLHRHTCFVAGKTRRGEQRRQARERQAVEMNAMDDHSAENLARITPVLDEAIDQLETEDRAAIMLRFFEQHDFRAVGEALGTSDEAARKRVDRALEKLEIMLKRRGVAFSAAALGAALTTQAVTAAPMGLAATVVSSALTGSVAGVGTTSTILKVIGMSKLKIAIISAVVVAGVTVPWAMQHQKESQLRAANEALQQQAKQISDLKAENERLAKAKKSIASATAPGSGPVARGNGERGRGGRKGQRPQRHQRPQGEPGNVESHSGAAEDGNDNGLQGSHESREFVDQPGGKAQ